MTLHLRRLSATAAIPAVGSLTAIVVAGVLAPDAAPGTAPARGIGAAAASTFSLLLVSGVTTIMIVGVAAVAGRALPAVGTLMSAAWRILPLLIVAAAVVVTILVRGGPLHVVPLGVILAVPAGLAVGSRLTGALAEQLAHTSVTMARTLGVDARRLLIRRALPAASLDSLPVVAAALGGLAVGAVVAEPLTGRSGLGLFIVDAVADGDAARQQVAAAVTVIAVTVAGVLGASARAAADPRIRLTGHP